MAEGMDDIRRSWLTRMSPSAANLWFDISNSALLIGAILVALGTYGVFLTGGIKERYADERTANAQQVAAKANENAETVRQSNIVLQTDLERERSARLKMENRFAPRRLNPDFANNLVIALKAYADTSIDVVTILGDSEAEMYASDFVRVLKEAGWNPGPNDGINKSVFTNTPKGVIVVVNQADQTSPTRSALQLREALKSLGLLTAAVSNPQVPQGSVQLVVGAKIDNR